MKIIGFNYTKISVEKKKEISRDLKISNKVDILNVAEVKQEVLKSKEEMLAVKFLYSLDYSPGIASVNLEGTILLAVDQNIAKEALKTWKDNKETPDSFKIFIFNVIFRKAGLKALELEDQMNLPLHMQMPAIKKSEDKSK
ncbi:MAG: hypothetical protein WD876_00295 [Candidatus Pacearchaeota archaeon]